MMQRSGVQSSLLSLIWYSISLVVKRPIWYLESLWFDSKIDLIFATIAQLEERVPSKHKVSGSIPDSSKVPLV